VIWQPIAPAFRLIFAFGWVEALHIQVSWRSFNFSGSPMLSQATPNCCAHSPLQKIRTNFRALSGGRLSLSIAWIPKVVTSWQASISLWLSLDAFRKIEVEVCRKRDLIKDRRSYGKEEEVPGQASPAKYRFAPNLKDIVSKVAAWSLLPLRGWRHAELKQ